MSLVLDTYGWRTSLRPIDQLFFAAGQAVPGGMTLGGISNINPEPGGLGRLRLQISQDFTTAANRDASWTAARIQNGAVMRIPFCASPQLVSHTALGTKSGLPWGNGQPWGNGKNWASVPDVAISGTAAKGATSFTVDLTGSNDALAIGHIIGIRADGLHFTHQVMNVTYDTLATVEISPPLRRAVTAADTMTFRPVMYARCINPQEAVGQLIGRRRLAFGPMEFVEALL